MASLKLRGSMFYIQFYQGGKQRRVNTHTDVLQIAKEKLWAFESAQARGDALPLATRTPIADIVTACTIAGLVCTPRSRARVQVILDLQRLAR